MGLYARRNEFFLFDGQLQKNEEANFQWYILTVISMFPNLCQFHKKLEETKSDPKFVNSLLFRILKLLYCLEFMGYEYYFGIRKKNPIEPDRLKNGVEGYKKGDVDSLTKLSGLANFNTQYKLFYHAEYFPSLITGILDNLTLLTACLYDIRMDAIRISLSTTSGKEFLEKIEVKNSGLKKMIDSNVDFRNLIYEFREKVIHREGLERIELPIAPNWSNFFKIDLR